jgi:hypothetical protein
MSNPRYDLFSEAINDLDLPTYIAEHDEDMDALVASIVDDHYPGLRKRLAKLIRQAYRAGVIDGLEDDARRVVGADGGLPRGDRTRLRRRLWNRAEDIREHANFPSSKPPHSDE